MSGLADEMRVTAVGGKQISDLDEKDRLLLRALRTNARVSLVALAREIDLSRSATHDRIARLEENGVIRGYTVNLAPAALPEVRAFMTVTFKVEESQTTVLDRIKLLPGVEAAYCVSGDIDSIIYCECDSIRQLSDLRDTLAGWDSVVSITIRQIIASSLD